MHRVQYTCDRCGDSAWADTQDGENLCVFTSRVEIWRGMPPCGTSEREWQTEVDLCVNCHAEVKNATAAFFKQAVRAEAAKT